MKRRRSDVNVDWNLCCICQKFDKEKLRSTESGLESLSDNLFEFYILNGLKFDVARISTTTVNGIPNICETLSANSAKYHHNCAARYNKRDLEALKQRNAEEIKDPRSASNSTRKSCGLAVELGAPLCCICGQDDDINALHAAGAYHAKKQKTDSKHVIELTGVTSLILRSDLVKSVSKSFPSCKLNVVFKSTNRLSSYFSFKDKIPIALISGVVYK